MIVKKYKLTEHTACHHSFMLELMMKFAHFIFAVVVLQIAVASSVPHYKPLTEEEAARLAAWTPEDQNMWQLSGQFEGDMVLAPNQRNGVINTRLRWSNRVIPYVFSADFTASEREFISKTLTQEYAKTCVTVRPRTTEVDYVNITGQNTGCWSQVGRIGGRQELNLQRNGCIWYGTITHEFLHAAGFYHQQSATERDDYVTIMWQNIQKGKEHNFNKYEANVVSSFGEKYDYGSVMHYDKKAFSSNGQPTIVPKDPNAVIGQRNGLSTTDIRKLNKMYGCA